jgi:hypothetical protein
MKTALAATLFAVASFPLLGQMPSTTPPDQPANPPTQMSTPPGELPPGAVPATPATQPETPATSQTPADSQTPPATADTAAATSQIPAADMRPVDGKLVSKLDSKTAKTGDDVVVQTESSVKTADGTEIPKGSKVVGHVVAVHPSAGQNSQVVLQFDRAELKDGKSMPIHSEIASVAPAIEDASSASPTEAMPGGAASALAGMPGAAGSPGVGNPGAGNPGNAMPGAAETPGATSATSNSPSAGTIVSRNGNIAIRTTSIPGVLLATNAPGQQDPRMAQASGFLLGASKDVELDSGTKITLNVAAAAANTK